MVLHVHSRSTGLIKYMYTQVADTTKLQTTLQSIGQQLADINMYMYIEKLCYSELHADTTLKMLAGFDKNTTYIHVNTHACVYMHMLQVKMKFRLK